MGRLASERLVGALLAALVVSACAYVSPLHAPMVSPASRKLRLPGVRGTRARGSRQRRLVPSAIIGVSLPSLASAAARDPWFPWSVLLGASVSGLAAERYTWGARLSAPLITMAISLALSNCGVLPSASPCYRTINQWLVPLSVPLLLFDADLRTVIKRSGALFTAFVIGAAGTIIGTIAACMLVPVGVGGEGESGLCRQHATHLQPPTPPHDVTMNPSIQRPGRLQAHSVRAT